MENKELFKKMIKKAGELWEIAENDRKIYGDCYVEFSERGIKIIDPKDLIIKLDTDDPKKIKEFKKKWDKEKH